jgi:hypothetical protein
MKFHIKNTRLISWKISCLARKSHWFCTVMNPSRWSSRLHPRTPINATNDGKWVKGALTWVWHASTSRISSQQVRIMEGGVSIELAKAYSIRKFFIVRFWIRVRGSNDITILQCCIHVAAKPNFRGARSLAGNWTQPEGITYQEVTRYTITLRWNQSTNHLLNRTFIFFNT